MRTIDAEKLIVEEHYFNYDNKIVTGYFTLKNGYVVTTYAGLINPDNFDFTKGKKIAYDKAIAEIMKLEGYAGI